jgi:pimeloyl-ACP methyl ester carboxylesterase
MAAAADKRLVYLGGLAGTPELSPALAPLVADGWEIVLPDLPGFNGRSGFRPPASYLDWLTITWDALDTCGALPCPVIGASVGAMLAAELAAFRPEAVTALVLLAPFGIADDAHPGLDLYALPAAERLHLRTASPTSDPRRRRSPGTCPTLLRRACCGRSATAALRRGSTGSDVRVSPLRATSTS